MLDKARLEVDRLRLEKNKAIDYFAQKRTQDIQALQKSIDVFNAKLTNISSNFENHGPFSLSWKSDEALQELKSVLSKVKQLEESEDAIVKASAELVMEYTTSGELVYFEERVTNLCTVWQVQGEWEKFEVRNTFLSVS